MEILNLYNLSSNPEQLAHHDEADEVPTIAWQKYGHNEIERENHKALWAKDPDTSYLYSQWSRKPFPEGEEVIATKGNWGHLMNYINDFYAYIFTTYCKANGFRNPDFYYNDAETVVQARKQFLLDLVNARKHNTEDKFVTKIVKAAYKTDASREAMLKVVNKEAGGRIEEGLNLFGLHNDPSSLDNYDKMEQVPELLFDLFKKDPKSIRPSKVFENYLLEEQPLGYAVDYAIAVLKGPFPEFEQKVLALNKSYDGVIGVDGAEIYRYALLARKQRWPEIESILLAGCRARYTYISYWIFPTIKYTGKFIKQRWPELEKIILAFAPKAIVYYAQYVLHGPWPEAEEALLRTPRRAIDYVLDYRKSRWPEFEKRYSKASKRGMNSYWLSRYDKALARLGLSRDKALSETMNLFGLHSDPKQLQHHELEDMVPEIAWNKYTSREDRDRLKHIWAKDSDTAYDYARETGRPFPEGEAEIATNSHHAYNYAKMTARHRHAKRWPPGEAAIAQDSYYALQYADFIGERFLEGEKTILGQKMAFFNPPPLIDYAANIIRGRWPELEEKLLAHENTYYLFEYAKRVVRGKWPALEDVITVPGDNIYETGRHAQLCYEYARDIIHAPFPKGEPIIAVNPRISYIYADQVLNGKPFLAGEETIANSPLAKSYAVLVYNKLFKNNSSASYWLKTKAYNDAARARISAKG